MLATLACCLKTFSVTANLLQSRTVYIAVDTFCSMYSVFGMTGDPQAMVGLTDLEAAKVRNQ